MICLIHGYGLTGSGSNLWSRAIARGLCENGVTVHLVCQESRPELQDFVAEAYVYAPDGTPELLFRRDAPYEGRCVLHRPQLEVLPTYVRPPQEVTSMKSILDLEPDAIDDYLERNENALTRVLATYDIDAMHVNHVVLMAEVARRVSARTGVPFAVMPHGSAIEYIVKHDAAMQQLAAGALQAADRIFTLSSEMRERLRDVFPSVTGLDDKMVMASAGVDTRQFDVLPRAERPASIARLKEQVADSGQGQTPERRKALQEALDAALRRAPAGDLTLEEIREILRPAADYPPRRPDADLDDQLDQVDWAHDDIVVFVGKITGYKGIPALVAAFPEILARRPRARLVVAGRGQLREGLEAFIWALSHGHADFARRIAAWGDALEGQPEAPFERVVRFFDALEERGELGAYFDLAQRTLTPDRVVFTGYLEHDALSHLFPCCDVAVFPSVVKEAAPLVVPEAMASGCFPVGTDYAGMATSLDVAARAVSEEDAACMRLRHDPQYTVGDMVEHVPQALAVSGRYRDALRETAVRERDWRSVARRLAGELRALRSRA